MKNLAKIFALTVLFAVIVFSAAADERARLLGEWGKAKDPEGYQWFAFEEDGDTITFSSAGMMGFEEDSLKLVSYDGSTLNAVYHVARWWEDDEFDVPFTLSVQISGNKLTISGLTDNPDTLIYLSSYNGTYTKEE